MAGTPAAEAMRFSPAAWMSANFIWSKVLPMTWRSAPLVEDGGLPAVRPAISGLPAFGDLFDCAGCGFCGYFDEAVGVAPLLKNSRW